MAKKKEETQEAVAASEMAENTSVAVQADAENMENTVDTDDTIPDATVETPADSNDEADMPGVDDPGNVGVKPSSPDSDEAETEGEPVEKPKQEQGNALVNLSVLADRHRIPSWQQAALLRYMGWQDDKLVSDKDYMAAMQALKTRRIGGGRR